MKGQTGSLLDQIAEVKYAVAGLGNKLFVSRYKLHLPSEKEPRAFIRKDIKALERTPFN